MSNPRMKHMRVVHKSTAGILKPIPEALDLVGNPPPGLTTNTVASLSTSAAAAAGMPRSAYAGVSGALIAGLVSAGAPITCEMLDTLCSLIGAGQTRV